MMNEQYQHALSLFQEQDFPGAEKIVSGMYEETPNDPDVAYFLAIIKSKAGDYPEAVRLFNEVLQLNKNHTEAYYNVALVYQNMKMYEEALCNYKMALRLNPFLTEAHNNLALVQKALGNYSEAEKEYEQAVKAKTDNQNAVSSLTQTGKFSKGTGELSLAQQFYDAREYEKALEVLLRIYPANSGNGDLINMTGMVYYFLKNFEEAVKYFQKLIDLNIKPEQAHYSIGVCFQESENYDLALKHYESAVEISPYYPDALNNLGLLYDSLKRYDEAERCYRKVLEKDPEYFNSIINLGALKVNTDRVPESYQYFEKAIELSVSVPEPGRRAVAYGNVGFAKMRELDLIHAVKYFDLALEQDKDYMLAHYNKSEALLLAGLFKEGWKEYEWRVLRKDFGMRKFLKPLPKGVDLTGKRVLVYAEQGIGDAIQFVRYLSMLKGLGAYIIFECDKSLFGLMKSVSGVDELVEKNPAAAPAIKYDYEIPILSLGLYFNTNLENIPDKIPYIYPEKEYLEKWEKIIKDSGKFKIGIVWAGNPKHAHDRHRSVRLNRFLPLFSIEGTEFFSLQKGFPVLQAKDCQLLFTNLDDQINSYSDTAAAISRMDLIITVDTSVAHLAAAMGKAVWTLLPYVPDWRWMLNRTDTPWYPDMKLYRQPKLWDWDSVFKQVKTDLTGLVNFNKLNLSKTYFDRLKEFLSKIEDETYPEIPTQIHSQITPQTLERLLTEMPLAPDAKILDIGCGQGPALEVLKNKGFDPIGITLNDEDVSICRAKGFKVFKMDQSFLEFEDGTFDFIWSRHCLEHSFAPYFTLSEYFRVSKSGAGVYIEVPAPETAAHHENNPNHYSVLSKSMWISLIKRSGFILNDMIIYNLSLPVGKDEYWGFICQKPAAAEALAQKDEKLYLGLMTGDNQGWGICSKYLSKELSKKINIIHLDGNREFKEGDKIPGTVLHALRDRNFDPVFNQWGKRNFGYTFFETVLTGRSIENAEKYEKVIGGSTWNRDKMLEKGIINADYLIQGIDPELFYPGSTIKNSDLFIIFSGGKFELRKGQDLVLRAFKILEEKYPDIVLINAWYNMWPVSMDSMTASKFIKYERRGENWQQFMVNLLKMNNIDGNKVFTLPITPNEKMREIYLRSDIGLFPNRCEGGTNLMLMEYMACGKPVIASYNSGHKDILTEENSLPLMKMNNLKLFDDQTNELLADWEEPELDEIVARLEYAYQNREALKAIGSKAGSDLKSFTWQKAAERLLKILK